MRYSRVLLVMGLATLTTQVFASEGPKKIKPAEPKVAIVFVGTVPAKADLARIFQEVFSANGFEVTQGETVSLRASDLQNLGRELGVQNIIPVQAKISTRYAWMHGLPRARSQVELETAILTTTSDVKYFNLELIDQMTSVYDGGYHQEALCLTPVLPLWPLAFLTGGSLNSSQRQAIRKAVEQTYARFFEVQLMWGRILYP